MKIGELYIYPVKSLRGISVPSVTLTEHGVPEDRRFMLYKDHGSIPSNPEHNGTEYELMHVAYQSEVGLFRTALPSPSTLRITHLDPSSNTESHIEFPLQPDPATLPQVQVNMHGAPLTVYLMQDASAWFSARLGYAVALVYFGAALRPVIGNVAPNAAERNPQRRLEASGPQTVLGRAWAMLPSWAAGGNAKVEGPAVDPRDYGIAAQDAAPYLVTSQASLDDVTRRFEGEARMDVMKFRPNIVVAGAEHPFEEDYWGTLRLRDHEGEDFVMQLTTPCARCISITVDYDTGKYGTGPLGKVYKLLQKDRRVDEVNKWSPVFGRYAFLDRDSLRGRREFRVSVGDEVELLSRIEKRGVLRWPGIGSTPKDDLYPVE